MSRDYLRVDKLIPKAAEIEKYFKGKELYDFIGWAGEFHLTAKDIIGMLTDLLGKNNAETIRNRERQRLRNQYKKFKKLHGDSISDKYIIHIFRMNHGIKKEDVTPEMIELKRKQILDYRLKVNNTRSKRLNKDLPYKSATQQ